MDDEQKRKKKERTFADFLAASKETPEQAKVGVESALRANEMLGAAQRSAVASLQEGDLSKLPSDVMAGIADPEKAKTWADIASKAGVTNPTALAAANVLGGMAEFDLMPGIPSSGAVKAGIKEAKALTKDVKAADELAAALKNLVKKADNPKVAKSIEEGTIPLSKSSVIQEVSPASEVVTGRRLLARKAEQEVAENTAKAAEVKPLAAHQSVPAEVKEQLKSDIVAELKERVKANKVLGSRPDLLQQEIQNLYALKIDELRKKYHGR